MQFLQVSYNSPAYQQVLDLRETVLRQPLGISLKNEDLSKEANDIILAAFEGNEIRACLLLTPLEGGWYKLRQMAVAAAHQQTGLGRRLVGFAEEWVQRAGGEGIRLHARYVAIGFYEKLGYQQEGGMFLEVGIPHVLMKKDI